MSIFPKGHIEYSEKPMFLGGAINVARYDSIKYKVLEGLTEKQLGFFWRPEEVDLSKDKVDFQKLSESEQHIFTSNLKYQILLDSVQGRGPGQLLGDLASLPEVETWLITWGFSETIHSRSYTHIIRNVYNNPSEVFDTIMITPEILSRAEEVAKYYDQLEIAKLNYRVSRTKENLRELKRCLLLAMFSINILEAIRFYVSFCCSFAFAERKSMEGNAKIIKLIARDEALHLKGTQFMLRTMINSEGYADLYEECKDEVYQMFDLAAEQEIAWANYLFSKGTMLGLNVHVVENYVKYITNNRMLALGLEPIYASRSNPVPWMNTWLTNDNVQVAPQETEISSYMTADLDGTINVAALSMDDL